MQNVLLRSTETYFDYVDGRVVIVQVGWQRFVQLLGLQQRRWSGAGRRWWVQGVHGRGRVLDFVLPETTDACKI